jgi:hypothetical protein
MKGDFSRVTFDPANHFSRVLMQQGRVTLDADHNEQADIGLHMLRTLARDLFGPYGGPAGGRGFGLYVGNSTAAPFHLMIGAGHYYVDGILCECEQEYDYANQPDYAPAPVSPAGAGDLLLSWLANPTAGQMFWIYLDVWERHISWVEDDRIREVALGGPDTCTRSKVVWQVKAVTVATLIDSLTKRKAAVDAMTPQTQDTRASSIKLEYDIALLQKGPQESVCAAPLDALDPIGNAQLAARLDPGLQIPDPCSISPDALYRGAENQLYRVEIQQGGTVGDAAAPSFKWSRDNGSIVAAWLGTDGNDLIVNSARGFSAGNWVELSDDRLDLQGVPGLLLKLASVQNDRLSVAPDSIAQGQSIAWTQQLSNPKVRRWDQTENDAVTLALGAVPIVEASAASPNWIDLEDGIQVQFAAGGQYRSGDYWLIPARVATGSIEWPSIVGADNSVTPALQAPRGIHHHYAPLGFVQLQPSPTGAQGIPSAQTSCRNCCSPLTANNCGTTQAPTTSMPLRALIALKPVGARSAAATPKKSRTGESQRASRKRAAKAKRR